MTHVANQRLKIDGKAYAAGDPITFEGEIPDDIPEGAVSEAAPEKADAPQEPANSDAAGQAGDPGQPSAPLLTEDEQSRLDALTNVVDQLPTGDFKKDGGIRADALKGLIETLGFEVTAEDVAAVRKADGDTGSA